MDNSGKTFGDLFSLYFERHVKVRTRNPANAHYFYKCHGPRWRDIPVSQITRYAVQDWVDELGQRSPTAATRAVNMLSAVINWGIRRGYVQGDNPCRGVERFAGKSRERFLMPDEIERFKAALDKEPELVRDFFWMCLLTGARRGNVQAMRWCELDLTLAIWRFDSKNGEVIHLPLSTAALAILQRRQRYSHEYVFPSHRGRKGFLGDPKRAWQRVLKRAGIDDLRIHDLRRTMGSYLAIHGASPYLIGKALGHKDQRSTAVYARLHLDPVRHAVQDVQEIFIKSPA